MTDELLKIINLEQATFYLSKGVKPKDIQLGRKNKIMFLFSKAETYELFGEWLEISARKREGKKLIRQNYSEIN